MPAHNYAVSPADGPIAVTGASGYIGSWIVQDCMEQGYEVRACVRDANNPAKTAHLLELDRIALAMHQSAGGEVGDELIEAFVIGQNVPEHLIWNRRTQLNSEATNAHRHAFHGLLDRRRFGSISSRLGPPIVRTQTQK